VKCTGTLFDNFSSGEITLSCTHSFTVLPGFPNFHLWLTALTPGSESLRRCSGQFRPWESTHVYATVAGPRGGDMAMKNQDSGTKVLQLNHGGI
jgi:hypothetical protein